MRTSAIAVSQDPLAAAASFERHRRSVVTAITAIYWLLLLEGVLRKWVMPQWGKPLFFIRDPFVLWVYFMVFTHRVKVGRPAALEIGCAFGFIGGFLALLHYTSGSVIPPVLMAYGWRNYFFNLPLAFVIARYVRIEDIERIARYTVLFAIPMAALMSLQVHASVYAPINAGFGAGRDQMFLELTTTGGVVRAAGVFTSSVGLMCFTSSAIASAIAIGSLPAARRRMNLLWFLLSVCALVMCLGLSGSRGAIVWGGLMIVGGIVGLVIVGPRISFNLLAVTALVAAAGFTVLPIFFPRITEAFVRRWVEAGQNETRLYGSGGVFARARNEVVNFRLLIDATPALGYGLGSAGNAAWKLGTRSEIIAFDSPEQKGAAETDWGRNVLELGPAVGLCFIAFRIGFAAWLVIAGFQASHRTGQLLPWILGIFAGSMLFNAQITANGSLCGYAWLFTGFCMAATMRAHAQHAGSRVRWTATQDHSWPIPRCTNRAPVWANLERTN